MGYASTHCSLRRAALLVFSLWAACQRTPPPPVKSPVADAAVISPKIPDASVVSKPDLTTPLSVEAAEQLTKDPDAAWDRRLAAFSQLLAVRPDNPALLTELAIAAYGQNDLKVAEDAARRALSKTQDPTLRGLALYQLGLVQEERGELSSATETYQQALRLKPTEELRARLAVIPQVTPDDVKFRVWLSAYAKTKGMYVQDSWSDNLDADPERERVAILCNHNDLDATYVVEKNATKRWSFIAREDGSRHPHCSAGERGPKWRIVKASEIDLSQYQHQEHDTLAVALRNGRPAVISQGYDVWDFEDRESERHDVKLSVDWDKLVGSSQDNQGIYAWPLATVLRARNPKELHSLLPVLKPEAQGAPQISATVVQGRPAWKGPQDASLSLAATTTSDHKVRLDLLLVDDVSVPATGESPTTGDYVELQISGDDLLVSSRSDGSFLLKPGKRGWKGILPTASGRAGKLEILFPPPEATDGQGEPLSPYPQSFQTLQVKFHDRDKIGGPEESVLGFPLSLVLVALPSNDRYPVPKSLTEIHDERDAH